MEPYVRVRNTPSDPFSTTRTIGMSNLTIHPVRLLSQAFLSLFERDPLDMTSDLKEEVSFRHVSGIASSGGFHLAPSFLLVSNDFSYV